MYNSYRNKNNSLVEGITGVVIGLFFLAFYLCIALFPTWVVASGITSGVKAVSEDCSSEYPVPIVSQDWFCAEKND